MPQSSRRRGQRRGALPSFVLGVALVLGCLDPGAPLPLRFSGFVYDVVEIDGKPLPDSGDIRLPPFDSLKAGRISGGLVAFGDFNLLWETTFKVNGDTQTYYRQLTGNYLQAGDTAVFLGGPWAVRRGDTLTLRPNASADISAWLGGKTWRLMRRVVP